MAAVTDSIFLRLDADRYEATELARGPWDPGALHGSAPGALVAGALEATIAAADLHSGDGTPVEFLPARLTVELVRPVPLGELAVTTTMRRPGRRICIVDGQLADAAGDVVLTATLQGIRRRPFDHGVPDRLESPPPPTSGVPLADVTLDGPPAFHRNGVEHRFVRGARFEETGPAADWIRLTVPLVDDEPVTPLQRAVVAADFGNGVSREFDFETALFLNPDLTVLLHRLPVGEWVCIDAVTRFGPDGVGLAESVLHDEHGPIGRATQTLLVEPR